MPATTPPDATPQDATSADIAPPDAAPPHAEPPHAEPPHATLPPTSPPLVQVPEPSPPLDAELPDAADHPAPLAPVGPAGPIPPAAVAPAPGAVPGPAPSPWAPPPPWGPPAAQPPAATEAGRPAPVLTAPAGSWATALRRRRGLLVLVVGLVCALLLGTLLIVVLRPGRGAPVAGAASTDTTGRPSGSRAPGEVRDDFTASLDKAKWSVYGTSPPSTFSPDMVRVQDGELQVVGAGNNPTAAANKAGGLCWCVNGNFRYGTWQVRARFDAGSGYRDAIVLWPQSGNKSTDGSVNLATDADAARKALVVSLQPPGGGASEGATRDGDFTAWHVYRVDWRASYVRMYVDDVLIYDSSAGTPKPVPHGPMHLVIQLDKGPAGGIPAANEQTPAEVVLHVDWVSYHP
jgi:hypothetical protein